MILLIYFILPTLKKNFLWKIVKCSKKMEKKKNLIYTEISDNNISNRS